MHNITVNAIPPGLFPTSLTAHLRNADGAPTGMLDNHTPLNRMSRPDDIAGLVIVLSSRAGSYVTGAEVPVDGGITGCR